MKSIKLPNRYYNDVKLIYVRQDGDFYVFKPNDHHVWQYCSTHYADSDYKQIVGIDPDGGPNIHVGYKINNLVLDHLECNPGILFYFKKKTTYKVAAMSDIHGYLPENVEECDIVCIAGDIMPLEIQRDVTQSFKWFKETFFPWINNLPCEKVFLIGGNHDFLLYWMNTKAVNRFVRENCYDKLIYLNNTLVEYDNLKIYGCPNVENLESWAFYTEFGSEYVQIPNCDILLTHMPPAIGNLGYIPKYGDLGSIELKKVIESRNIKLVLCGHMHDGNKEEVIFNNTKLKNVAIKDDNYMPVYPVYYTNIECSE